MIIVDPNQLTPEQVDVVVSLTDLPTTPAGQHIAKTGPGTFANTPDSGGGGGGSVDSVVAGDNVTVDNTDPANPIVSAFVGEVDGGVASSVYTSFQVINGGNA